MGLWEASSTGQVVKKTSSANVEEHGGEIKWVSPGWKGKPHGAQQGNVSYPRWKDNKLDGEKGIKYQLILPKGKKGDGITYFHMKERIYRRKRFSNLKERRK